MSRPSFKWITEWNGIILSEDNLILPNTWSLVIEYNTVSDNMLHRDIAMQRLNFMIEEKFSNSIWTNLQNRWVPVFHEKMDAFVITLPSDPYDSLIAAAALLKAQSITEGVFDMQSASIVSKLGYNVENFVAYDEAKEMEMLENHKNISQPPWFKRPDAGFTDLLLPEEDGFTLIKDVSDWNEFELGWDHYDDEANSSAVESFANSNANERWIPLVIKGGANNQDED